MGSDSEEYELQSHEDGGGGVGGGIVSCMGEPSEATTPSFRLCRRCQDIAELGAMLTAVEGRA